MFAKWTRNQFWETAALFARRFVGCRLGAPQARVGTGRDGQRHGRSGDGFASLCGPGGPMRLSERSGAARASRSVQEGARRTGRADTSATRRRSAARAGHRWAGPCVPAARAAAVAVGSVQIVTPPVPAVRPGTRSPGRSTSTLPPNMADPARERKGHRSNPPASSAPRENPNARPVTGPPAHRARPLPHHLSRPSSFKWSVLSTGFTPFRAPFQSRCSVLVCSAR